MRYTHRFQKFISACIGLSFSPESLWQVKDIIFRFQEVFAITRNNGGSLGEIKAAAVIIYNIVAFLIITSGLRLLNWVRILWGFGNLSGFGYWTNFLEFGKIGVWLVIAEVCNEILKVLQTHTKNFSKFHFEGFFFLFTSSDGESLIESFFEFIKVDSAGGKFCLVTYVVFTITAKYIFRPLACWVICDPYAPQQRTL